MKALETVSRLLDEPPEKRVPFTLRPHQPGDMGWIIRRQTQLYASEFGWDGSFEAMLAEIAGKFIAKFDPKSDNCWIAERNGEIVGSVFLVRAQQDHRPVPHALCRAFGARPGNRSATGRSLHRAMPVPRAIKS